MFSGTELGTHLCQVDVRLEFPARGGCGCEWDLGEWGEANMTQFALGQLTTSDTRSPAQTAQTLPSHSLLPGVVLPEGCPAEVGAESCCHLPEGAGHPALARLLLHGTDLGPLGGAGPSRGQLQA